MEWCNVFYHLVPKSRNTPWELHFAELILQCSDVILVEVRTVKWNITVFRKTGLGLQSINVAYDLRMFNQFLSLISCFSRQKWIPWNSVCTEMSVPLLVKPTLPHLMSRDFKLEPCEVHSHLVKGVPRPLWDQNKVGPHSLTQASFQDFFNPATLLQNQNIFSKNIFCF